MPQSHKIQPYCQGHYFDWHTGPHSSNIEWRNPAYVSTHCNDDLNLRTSKGSPKSPNYDTFLENLGARLALTDAVFNTEGTGWLG